MKDEERLPGPPGGDRGGGGGSGGFGFGSSSSSAAGGPTDEESWFAAQVRQAQGEGDKQPGALQNKSGRVFVDMDELERQKDKEEKMKKLREEEARQQAKLQKEIAEAEAAMDKVRNQDSADVSKPPGGGDSVLRGVQSGLAAAFGGGGGGGGAPGVPPASSDPNLPLPGTDEMIFQPPGMPPGASYPPPPPPPPPASSEPYAPPTAAGGDGAQDAQLDDDAVSALRTTTNKINGKTDGIR